MLKCEKVEGREGERNGLPSSIARIWLDVKTWSLTSFVFWNEKDSLLPFTSSKTSLCETKHQRPEGLHVSGLPWWQILLNVYLKEIYCLWWSVTCSTILTVWLVLSNGQRISHQFQGLAYRVLVHLFLLLANSRCKHEEGVHGRAGEEADVNMGKETTHHIFMSYERWCGQARLQGGLRRRRYNTC